MIASIAEKHYIELAKHIYWEDGKPHWNKFRSNKVKKDQLAGTIINGYRVIVFEKKHISAHRLLWYMIYNEIPKMLDHINRCRDDNRIENLRLCTYSENRFNTGCSSRNKSGVKGVYFQKNRNKWCVQLKINGKSKHFGYFVSLEDAILNQIVAAKINYGEFYNADELLDQWCERNYQ